MGNADALSRCPLPDPADDPTPGLPILLLDILETGPVTSAEVARHSGKDTILKRVTSWVQRGWPLKLEGEECKQFERRKEELSVQGGCLLWGDRVVIPNRLKERVLQILHEGHPGIVRMKGLARSYVWWPNMDKDIECWVGKCTPCQDSRPDPPVAPPRKWETARGPWSRVHIDFAGPFHGQTFLIIVDSFSKWVEVKLMKSTIAEATIGVLRGVFATHGYPDTIVSDNGPQFTAHRFEEFLADRGIRHILSAPFHPASNGLAERFVRTTKEALGRLGPGDWQERIDEFLMAQHSTPCTGTRKSPAEILMGRKLRGKLDRLNPNYSPTQIVQQMPRTRELREGTPVHARNYAGDGLWLPGTIVEQTGPKSYKVEMDDGRLWRRHIDQLRRRLGKEPVNECIKSEPNYAAKPLTATSLLEPEPYSTEPTGDDSSPQPQELPESLQGGTESLSNTPKETLNVGPRRSERVRQRPRHLEDYVCKEINFI